MGITFRNYTNEIRFTDDFNKVCDFIIQNNIKDKYTMNFPWNRWEWMFSRESYDPSLLSKIGIWEQDGKIVAVATFEDNYGDAYLLCSGDHTYLKKDMLQYAKKNLSKGGKIRVLISDSDRHLQRLAIEEGFRATTYKECVAAIDCAQTLEYSLPDGFYVTSLADDFDLYKMNRVLWRGFNHEGMAPEDDESIEGRRVSISGPHVDLDLIIAVVAPDGEFVAFCGMWYDPSTDFALVEPVATDPKYRKMGLGKAAVLEGIRRCKKLGAKVAYVGSSQQFYYSIGFAPVINETWWEI